MQAAFADLGVGDTIGGTVRSHGSLFRRYDDTAACVIRNPRTTREMHLRAEVELSLPHVMDLL